MLSPERRAVVDNLSDEELAYEVELGAQSRFQRDLFAYAKASLAARQGGDEERRHDEQLQTQGAGIAATLTATRVALYVGIGTVFGGLIGAAIGAWATMHSAACL